MAEDCGRDEDITALPGRLIEGLEKGPDPSDPNGDPTLHVGWLLEQFVESAVGVRNVLPGSGEVTVAREQMIVGTLGELKDRLGEIQRYVRDARPKREQKKKD
jgi:hypothetical protein